MGGHIKTLRRQHQIAEQRYYPHSDVGDLLARIDELERERDEARAWGLEMRDAWFRRLTTCNATAPWEEGE